MCAERLLFAHEMCEADLQSLMFCVWSFQNCHWEAITSLTHLSCILRIVLNAFSEFIVKSACAHQKFAVKNVDSIPKFIVFFAIRWYTIFAV
jgi:hypothetical protein